ncbi:DNA-binding transcriptional regulator, GntR family [Roseovarius pacificus]|uniref:DNA-binding transcriptional regulator, GntR family n=1 Tax=Roseovarius pacificus TaxID=337701 RepID=A0A1M7DUS7_9RHOB|nr:GntR family transcriptional regulator [Roseovarius pacificus]GGO57094.1 GntR family transcriptional regulator [Roseovarius pacificus]SHL83206.1 DNA-binding transcriptional regulator, GntR family [Roseovarius pacificus]
MNKAAGKLTESATARGRLPAHEVIYRQLRDLVLYGDLAPGQAVTIQGLTERLGAGMTPVREAIRRLIAEGALEFQGNRRVSVPLLNADNISELILARQWLDPHLSLRATERATPDDLEELTALDEALDRSISAGDLRGYLELNYRFHKRLYELAEAPILADLADGLWLRFGPSLRVVCGRLGTQNLPDKHKDLLEAMRAKDAEGAARAIREDVIQGMEQVRQSFDAPAVSN